MSRRWLIAWGVVGTLSILGLIAPPPGTPPIVSFIGTWLVGGAIVGFLQLMNRRDRSYGEWVAEALLPAERDFIRAILAGSSATQELIHLQAVAHRNYDSRRLAGVTITFLRRLLHDERFIRDVMSGATFEQLRDRYAIDWNDANLQRIVLRALIDLMRSGPADSLTASLYAILGVGTAATALEIRSAYVDLAKRWHPDVAGAGNTERMAGINAAYEVLSNERTRLAYDEARTLAKRP